MNTLMLKKADFYTKVARFLGWANRPGGYDALSTSQKDVIKDCVDSGLRNFYWPPPVATSGPESYQWSFLTPVGQVQVEANTNSVPLPQDFDGFLSKLTISQDASPSALFVPIQVISEARMREMLSRNPSTSGRPLFAADVPIKGVTTQNAPQRELMIYPQADQLYVFRFQYVLLPECLTDDYPFAYGGQAHSETILQSCLRVAEERVDDVMGGTQASKFLELLTASISRDRQHKPHLIGYNADHSDALEYRRGWFADYWQPVTYKGLPMESF